MRSSPGRSPGPSEQPPVAIAPDASCQAAFQIIARACLHQIVANQNPTRDGDPEGVHQARVGLRRLRAAISLFGGMLLDPQSGTIKRELKWITGELGPARELDVFIKGVVTPATAGKSQQPGVATLTRDLRRRRREAFGRARSAIESDRFRMLVLDIAAWIEAGDWTRNADELARAIRDQPIATAAAAEMERRRKKIVKRGTKLAELDPVRRHRMRIQAKKLRYASEFFGVTFPGKKAARRRKEFIAALERLQDTLGDLNDISVHEGLTERLAEHNRMVASANAALRTRPSRPAACPAARRRASPRFLRMRSGPMPASQRPNRSGGRPAGRITSSAQACRVTPHSGSRFDPLTRSARCCSPALEGTVCDLPISRPRAMAAVVYGLF